MKASDRQTGISVSSLSSPPQHSPQRSPQHSPQHSPSAQTLLSLKEITQRFGSLVALDNVSFSVRAGEVHALLGENGAGKTTLMRIAFGLLKPNSGSLSWLGAPLQVQSPRDALAAGIGMVHQHFTLVPAMTVAENVALGRRGRYNSREAIQLVRDVCARTGLELDPLARVDTLGVGAQQRCEIVKALARNVKLLILDEPTAVLAPSESQEVLQWVRRFADVGNAVVLITHKLRDALAVSDRVTVLRAGTHILTADTSLTTESALGAAMLGAELATDNTNDNTERSATPARNSKPVLSISAVSVRDEREIARLNNATLSVHSGEIIGVAAIEGSGQRELLRILAGRLEPSQGTVLCPPDVGFVPEDRIHDALMSDAPLFENMALHGAGVRRGRMRWAAFRKQTLAVLERFDVRAMGVQDLASTLSGGNQQKFVLGRELMASPRALVVENPSRGLDFKASAAVHLALRNARNSGCAVVLYSSDLDEVLMLADRVVVLSDGRLTEMTAPFGRTEVGQAMLGAV